MNDKLILSIYYGEHDSCVTFANQNEVLLHLEAERYFRIKHMRLNPSQMDKMIIVGLNFLGATAQNIDEIFLSKWGWYNDYSLDYVKIQGKNFLPSLTSHHLCHIGTILASNFDETLVICADGGSEDGTTKVYLKKPDKVLFLDDLGNTILTGRFYGTITQIVIDPNFDNAHVQCPGKLMGLAALGSYSQEFYELITKNREILNHLYIHGCSHLNKMFGISENYEKVWLDKKRLDLAFTAQKIWIDEFLQKISEFKHLSSNICLSGGCALNVILNSKLAETGWFKNVYISPISGDGGQSLGAILYHYPNLKCNYPFLGRNFGEFEENPDQLPIIIKDLSEGKIVAWYQGQSAIGARALGHRSFLGIANSVEMRKKLSEHVKGREPYRPVACIMTEEFLPNFTREQTLSPFMTFAPKVYPDIKKNLPAIVHFNGRSRIQTLNKASNPLLHKILTKIGEKTGYPVLMNSSFNIAGEPIVDTPYDALKTFKKSLADVLYINGSRMINFAIIFVTMLNALLFGLDDTPCLFVATIPNFV